MNTFLLVLYNTYPPIIKNKITARITMPMKIHKAVKGSTIEKTLKQS